MLLYYTVMATIVNESTQGSCILLYYGAMATVVNVIKCTYMYVYPLIGETKMSVPCFR